MGATEAISIRWQKINLILCQPIPPPSAWRPSGVARRTEELLEKFRENHSNKITFSDDFEAPIYNVWKRQEKSGVARFQARPPLRRHEQKRNNGQSVTRLLPVAQHIPQ